MARNAYFSQAVASEQSLYEDLIIESLQIYGQEVYYLPRDILKTDKILGEDTASKYDSAYMLEAYIDNPEGFEGGGDLFQKFGIEIRDDCVFTVSKQVWQTTTGAFQNMDKPNEGDVIYLPLSNSYFEIMYVDAKTPFYQLSNLPVYKLTCSLYEYNDEEFDTGVPAIDNITSNWASAIDVRIDNTAVSGTFALGEIISQIQDATVTPNITVYGTLQTIDTSNAGHGIYKITNVGTSGTTTPRDFNTTNAVAGLTSGASASTIHTVYEINMVALSVDNIMPNDRQAQNAEFTQEADTFLDFSETNPFGEP
tara:strand:+ start:95 stop:1024 length:930 start_codon:yes stop_codon:yes gene_type:complete